MSNPFVLQQRVLKQILKDRPSVKDGMATALKAVQAAKHGEAWKKSGPVDWAKLEAKWVKWFDALLKKHPPEKRAGLLWFEVPSENNDAMTSVSGYEKLDRTEESFGLQGGRFWPKDKKGGTWPEGLLDLPELDGFFAGAGWGEDDNADKLLPGFYALAFAAATLLVLNELPKTKLSSVVQIGSGIGVVAGWVEGGEEAIGILTNSGWKPLTVDRKALKVNPLLLDPNSSVMSAKHYLAAGGDPNWREGRTGESVLMKQHEEENIRLLVEAGADVNAVDKKGRGVLHHLTELSMLGLLLERGADLHHRSQDGYTAFDSVCSHGGCEAEHLEMMWKAGGRPTRDAKGMLRPFRELGGHGPIEAEVLRFWKSKKFDLDERDQEGRTLLWVNLERHAKSCAELISMSPKERVEGSLQGELYQDAYAITVLEEGADPDQRLPESKVRLIPRDATPLMMRCYFDDRLVKALLKHGADPLAKSAEGKTALDYARAVAEDPKRLDGQGAEKIVRILEKAVAAAEKRTPAKKPMKPMKKPVKKSAERG